MSDSRYLGDKGLVMVISRITTKPFDELNNDTCTFIGSKIFTIRQLDVLTPDIYVNRSDSPWPLVFLLPMSYCGCLMYANDGRKKSESLMSQKGISSELNETQWRILDGKLRRHESHLRTDSCLSHLTASFVKCN